MDQGEVDISGEGEEGMSWAGAGIEGTVMCLGLLDGGGPHSVP